MSLSEAPLVSVIIPTHNRHRLVGRAIRSALRQTYDNLEVRVVDDGSDPPVILEDDLRMDPRVHLLRCDISVGSARARNAAADQCRGALLAFLDDDDEWFEQKLDRQLEVFAGQSEDVAGVESGFEVWNGTSLTLRYLPNPERDLARSLLYYPCMAPSSVMVLTSAFKNVGGFDPDLTVPHEDWDLWLRLTDKYRFVHIPEIHVRREEHFYSAERVLPIWQETWRRIVPRISSLSPTEQRRVRAHHEFMMGVLLAQVGRRKDSRSLFFTAWRKNPRNLRPLFHVARTAIGERSWARLRSGAKRSRIVFRSALGRDPFLERW